MKAGKCRMLGYDERCKHIYMILTIPQNKIISRKDCIFAENLHDYNIQELIQDDYEDEADRMPPLIIDPDDWDDDEELDAKVYGDNIAPYFPVTKSEYKKEVLKTVKITSCLQQQILLFGMKFVF